MRYIAVPNCSACPHPRFRLDKKVYCTHPKSINERIGAEGGQSKLSIHKYPRTPRWCPLPHYGKDEDA